MTGADHENGDGHPDDLAITNGIEAIDPFEPVDSVARHALHDPAPLALHPSTLALHADADHVFGADVAPPLHLSTTFLYPSDPDTMVTARERTDPGERAVPSSLVYSRISAPNLSRLESILSALLHAPSLTYTSGLAAVHALYTVIHPPRVFLTGGYHGVHGVVQLLHRVSAGGSFVSQPLSSAEELCGPGDVIHVETPLNPTGEVRPIAKYADLAHRRGAYVVVDATLGPPPLQDPFKHGADAVIHSGTKYFGGHSDMLLGVVATVKKDWVQQLTKDRVFLGAVPGNMEAWLGIRSLRTLGLRVERQARSAEKLVGWMSTILEGGAPRGLAVDPKDLEAVRDGGRRNTPFHRTGEGTTGRGRVDRRSDVERAAQPGVRTRLS